MENIPDCATRDAAIINSLILGIDNVKGSLQQNLIISHAHHGPKRKQLFMYVRVVEACGHIQPSWKRH